MVHAIQGPSNGDSLTFRVTMSRLHIHWHALPPWEREARLQLAESWNLTALVVLSLHELHLYMTHLVPRRAFSIMANSHDDLFDYTTGRWV